MTGRDICFDNPFCPCNTGNVCGTEMSQNHSTSKNGHLSLKVMLCVMSPLMVCSCSRQPWPCSSTSCELFSRGVSIFITRETGRWFLTTNSGARITYKQARSCCHTVSGQKGCSSDFPQDIFQSQMTSTANFQISGRRKARSISAQFCDLLKPSRWLGVENCTTQGSLVSASSSFCASCALL